MGLGRADTGYMSGRQSEKNMWTPTSENEASAALVTSSSQRTTRVERDIETIPTELVLRL